MHRYGPPTTLRETRSVARPAVRDSTRCRLHSDTRKSLGLALYALHSYYEVWLFEVCPKHFFSVFLEYGVWPKVQCWWEHESARLPCWVLTRPVSAAFVDAAKWSQTTFATNVYRTSVLDAGKMNCCMIFTTQYVWRVDEHHARKQALFCCVLPMAIFCNTKDLLNAPTTEHGLGTSHLLCASMWFWPNNR